MGPAPPRNPIRYVLRPCCAHAVIGHAAAALLSSVMNWRRLWSSMGSLSDPAVPAYRTLRLPWNHRQVLGLNLNCSESRHPGPPRLARSGPMSGWAQSRCFDDNPRDVRFSPADLRTSSRLVSLPEAV